MRAAPLHSTHDPTPHLLVYHTHLSHPPTHDATHSDSRTAPIPSRLGRTVPAARPQVSSVIKKNLNPVWDQKLEFRSRLKDFLDAPVEFLVYDKDFGSTDDLLGAAYLELQARAKPPTPRLYISPRPSRTYPPPLRPRSRARLLPSPHATTRICTSARARPRL